MEFFFVVFCLIVFQLKCWWGHLVCKNPYFSEISAWFLHADVSRNHCNM